MKNVRLPSVKKSAGLRVGETLKNITSILFLLISHYAFSQAAVVSDPALTKVQTEMLFLQQNNMLDQTNSLFESKNLLDGQLKHLETIDNALKEVNKHIKTISSVKMIFETNVDMLKRTEKTLQNLMNANLSADNLEYYSNQLASLVKKANQVIEMADFILSSGTSKMSDAERIMLLEKQREEIQQNNDRLIAISNDIDKQTENQKIKKELINFLEN